MPAVYDGGAMDLEQFLQRNKDFLTCQRIAGAPDLQSYWRFYASGMAQLSEDDRTTLRRVTLQVADLPAWWAPWSSGS